jgi:hypothetical protein
MANFITEMAKKSQEWSESNGIIHLYHNLAI